MGAISKDTYKRLLALCTIGEFSKGVYGRKRLQKILYFITRDLDHKPFTYQHKDYGQFSEELSDIVEQLVSMELVSAIPLASGQGNVYRLKDHSIHEHYCELLERVSSDAARRVRETVATDGYKSEQEIIRKAYNLDEFIASSFGDTLLQDDLPDQVETALSEDECDELEAVLNPRLVSALSAIAVALDKSDIDLDRIRKVAKPV